MKRQNQSLVFARLFTQVAKRSLSVATMVCLVLGGWLVLAGDTAESMPHDVVSAKKIVEIPPPSGSDNFVKERSPNKAVFTPREFDFQASPAQPAANPPGSKPQSYLIYVNEDSSLTLQQVQQLEPTAFVRQYKGRSLIQAGVFSQSANAQNLANELESKGIDVRIVNLATGEDTDFVSNLKFYFVVIPAKRDKLAAIEDQVQQLKMGMPIKISQQQQPRTHVRVGPFVERKQAENWKRYLKASGLRKARVYYGR